eukprot:scaffold26963_cov155-Skeletonema_dohrnii-CCMP3373.AAC.10
MDLAMKDSSKAAGGSSWTPPAVMSRHRVRVGGLAHQPLNDLEVVMGLSRPSSRHPPSVMGLSINTA